MKFQIRGLIVDCLAERETVTFGPFTYIHGSIGVGKTTIAKLMDFCLGAKYSPTPVLQPIWVGASLQVVINGRDLMLERKRDSNMVRAMWSEGDEPLDVMIPAREAGDIVVPGTDIAVLSDLIFHLAGQKPPRVRRGRQNDESDLVRLSFRDLFKYCYLDQDSMDSSFFDLDEHAAWPERNKARDVLRFLVGFHQEKVSALESELESVRVEQSKCEAGASALEEALEGENVSSLEKLKAALAKVVAEQHQARADLEKARTEMVNVRNHAADSLQEKGRAMAGELDSLNGALVEIETSIESDIAHRNSLRHLAVRQRRAIIAHADLGGVPFEFCPQCAQSLPLRSMEACAVCGQAHGATHAAGFDEGAIDADVQARADELDQRIKLQKRAADRMRAEREDLVAEKETVDHDLNEALKNYDSAYLSTYLELERLQARLGQRATSLRHLQGLAEKIRKLRARALELAQRATAIRVELKQERELAERDRANVTLLEQLFLDCVIRCSIPGISAEDEVQIRSPNFLPHILGHDIGNIVTTNYANMSSGGKKSLFKCCFAVAMHRLARKNNVLLPTLIVVDSAMKNISERTNNSQFVGFTEMLYQLSQGELLGTQFIVIDKEYYPPSEKAPDWLLERRMTSDDPKFPPLLTRHIGSFVRDAEILAPKPEEDSEDLDL